MVKGSWFTGCWAKPAATFALHLRTQVVPHGEVVITGDVMVMASV
jgi:hypothetical protein